MCRIYIPTPSGIIVNISTDNDRLYFVIKKTPDAKSEIYYKDSADILIKEINIPDSDIKYVSAMVGSVYPYADTVYASNDKLYRTRKRPLNPLEIPLDLKTIVSIRGCGERLYVLGKK